MKVEIFRGKDKQFYFRFKAANGQVAASSEGYTRRRDARRAAVGLVRAIKRNAIEIKDADRFYFKVVP